MLELIRRLLDEVGRAGATAAAVADAVGGDVVDSAAPLPIEAHPPVAGAGRVTITRQWESETPNSAVLELEPALPRALLEAEFGGATPVPGTGAPRILMLGDGDGPATVLAVLADDGDVRSVTVRREGGP